MRWMLSVGMVRWRRIHPDLKEDLSGGVGFVRWRRIGMWDETWDGMTTLRESRRFDSKSGIAEPELEQIAFGYRYASFDDLWDMLVRIAGPLAHTIEALPDDERHETRAVMMQNIEPYRVPNGSYSVPAATWGVHSG